MHNQDPYMYTVRECIGITDPGTDRVQQRNHNSGAAAAGAVVVYVLYAGCTPNQ